MFPSLSPVEDAARFAQIMSLLHMNHARMYWHRVYRNSTGAQRKRKTNRLQLSRKTKRKNR